MLLFLILNDSNEKTKSIQGQHEKVSTTDNYRHPHPEFPSRLKENFDRQECDMIHQPIDLNQANDIVQNKMVGRDFQESTMPNAHIVGI
jgi:hypothetical protein